MGLNDRLVSVIQGLRDSFSSIAGRYLCSPYSLKDGLQTVKTLHDPPLGTSQGYGANTIHITKLLRALMIILIITLMSYYILHM